MVPGVASWKAIAKAKPRSSTDAEMASWRARKQYIGQLELLAAVAVYYSLRDRLRGRRVIHFIDNSGAAASLVKDYSRDEDSALIVNTFWAAACALDVDVWFEFVYSEANIADWPSRGQVDFAAELGARADVRMQLPAIDTWGDVEPTLGLAAEAAEIPPPKRRRRR